jgi:hypothetical protein
VDGADKPGLLVYPKLAVCLDCGYSRFTTPEAELSILAMCSPKNGKGDVRNVALPSTLRLERECLARATGNQAATDKLPPLKNRLDSSE